MSIDLTLNAQVVRSAPYPDRLKAIISYAAYEDARRVIAEWPGYDPTPLVALEPMAKKMGVNQVWYKDESGRFGLNSFKALGGAYAVQKVLTRLIEQKTGQQKISFSQLGAGTFRDIVAGLTVTCATDGNHGRSVAWGAQLFGCGCVIYLHAGVSAAREKAIACYGAKIVRVQGNYDDSVRQAAEDADTYGRIVISDTSYPGYDQIPREVMQGYTVMVEEALAQLPSGEAPTHVFVQGGVGGLAAAVFGHIWESKGVERPTFVVVEPERAACLNASAKVGRPVAIHGALDTIMAGLACGEVSLIAWDILCQAVDWFMTISDEAALDLMRVIAKGAAGPALVAGESAVAGLAGCLALVQEGQGDRIGLDKSSRILVFGTEGDTDPELYLSILGKTAETTVE